jgi:prevent-host-death family protein
MESVGIRELRQRASELLRRVEAGETIEITDRSRPVAQLGPLPDGGARARLRSSGDLIPSTGSMADLPEPLPMPAGLEAPSVVLGRLRSGER